MFINWPLVQLEQTYAKLKIKTYKSENNLRGQVGPEKQVSWLQGGVTTDLNKKITLSTVGPTLD